MSESIKLFFKGFANAFNPDGYYNVVSEPRKLGDTARKIQSKRDEAYKKVMTQTHEKNKALYQ